MGWAQVTAACTFLLLAWSMGFSLLSIARARPETHAIIRMLSELAIGLATMSFLGIVLDLLRIPLHILVYIAIAAAYPAYALVRGTWEWKGAWSRKETVIACGALLLAIVLGAIYLQGAFGYPYLEDDDPWNHAQSVTYIARELTSSVTPEIRASSPGVAFYLEPYPPTFDVLLGIMRQTNNSTSWTLKFFNVLLVTLGIAFFFLFAKQFLESDEAALLATAAYAALPSGMSHFIWSQTLALALFPVGLYAVLRAADERSWRIPAVVAVGSMLVTQPVVSFVFGLVVLLLFALVALQEWLAGKGYARTVRILLVGALGVALGLVYWGSQTIEWGNPADYRQGGVSHWDNAYVLQSYTLSQVLFPPHSSTIDQAVGWGVGISLLAVAAFLVLFALRRKTLDLRKRWEFWFTTLWFAGLAYIVFAPSFGLPSYGTSRAWAYLALPLCLLVAQGAEILVRSVAKDAWWRIGAWLGLAALIIVTSLPAKVAVQTAQWPPGAHWTAIQDPNGAISYPDLSGYLQLGRAIPKNSRVFAFCGGDAHVIGFDMQSEPWDHDQAAFRSKLPAVSGEETIAFLKRHEFEYVTLDAGCIRAFGENETTALANRLTETQGFQQVLATPGFLAARVI